MNSANPNSKSVIDNRSSKLTQSISNMKWHLQTSNKYIIFLLITFDAVFIISKVLRFCITWVFLLRVWLWINFLSYLQINDKYCVPSFFFIIIQSIFKKMAKMTTCTYPYHLYKYIFTTVRLFYFENFNANFYHWNYLFYSACYIFYMWIL